MKPSLSKTTRRHALLAAAVAVALSGCALLTPQTPQERLRARAQARWDALLAGDFDRAYAYLSPGSKVGVTPARWRASLGGAAAWKHAEVAGVDCESSEKCIVRVRIEYTPLLLRGRLGTIDTHVSETWLLDSGQWWYVHRQ